MHNARGCVVFEPGGAHRPKPSAARGSFNHSTVLVLSYPRRSVLVPRGHRSAPGDCPTAQCQAEGHEDERFEEQASSDVLRGVRKRRERDGGGLPLICSVLPHRRAHSRPARPGLGAP
ncbi:MAG: hypothetical protein ACRDX8_05105 [Acidimicrobiales bacterium]